MAEKSIVELRSELQAKEQQVGKLQGQRQKLQRELADLDEQIVALTGRRRGGRPKKAAGKAAGKVGRRKKGRRIKRAGLVAALAARRPGPAGKSLSDYIKEILAKAPEGINVKGITQAVRDAGYETHSKDFYAIVAKTLLSGNEYRRVSRGVYKLG